MYTGGVAKSIQSINVAAVVAVAAAAAAAAGGLASPAATHYMKKLRVWRKTALFLSLFQFFWSSHLFFPMSMPALSSFSGEGGPIFFFKKIDIIFCWAFFGENLGHLLNMFLHPFVHLFSSAGVQLHKRTPSATSRCLS